jgi:diaminopimelate decarboxylase
MRARVRAYYEASAVLWPRVRLSYASKANGTLAVLAVMSAEGCWIDVASEGELRAALSAGIPAERCCMHGNNKSAAEIELALDEGIGEIVADNFEELSLLATAPSFQPNSRVLLRLAPGVDPKTHDKISTGQAETKFGFPIGDTADAAVRYCINSGLPLAGFHCHVGSQLLDPTAQVEGARAIAQFAVEMKRDHGFETQVLNLGGGLGVRYTDEEPMSIQDYCTMLIGAVKPVLREGGLEPELVQEPGRSLVAEAGTTLYTVGTVKTMAGTRYVVVDGGLGDNPRPALYGAKYALVHIPAEPRDASEPGPRTTVAGRHCETDTLFPQAILPADVQPGDLIQVLTTGAYASSMASNYNRYPRPATVLIRESGRVELVQRRETIEEMLDREIVPEDLLV